MQRDSISCFIINDINLNEYVELYATLLNVQALRKPLETDVGITAPRNAWRPLYHLLFPLFECSQASYIQEEDITPLIFNMFWKELPLSDYKDRGFL